LFNWNDRKEMIDNAIALARESGVDGILFTPTKSPLYGISLRYYFGSYIRSLGYLFNGKRRIDFGPAMQI
jgi:hypothetical protein